jgi:SpoVK/Ycf46/Vps4 family AAA+-type ATPase
MSGADLVPLGRSAPIELKRIISWAIRWKGIIVIDEAECALRRRFSQTNNHSTSDSADAAVARDIINVFLSLTGEASSDLMLIMVTCHPEMLDDAILDRCDEVFRLTLPMQNERLIIIQECFSEKYGPGNIRGRGKPPCPYSTKFDMELLRKLSSDDTEGFSGREINQVIKAIYEEALLTDEGLTECIWEQVSKRMCCSIKMKKRVLSE